MHAPVRIRIVIAAARPELYLMAFICPLARFIFRNQNANQPGRQVTITVRETTTEKLTGTPSAQYQNQRKYSYHTTLPFLEGKDVKMQREKNECQPCLHVNVKSKMHKINGTFYYTEIKMASDR